MHGVVTWCMRCARCSCMVYEVYEVCTKLQCTWCMRCQHGVLDVPYSGKLLRVQTFAKTPLEAPEDIFTVLIVATKPCILQYQLDC